MLPNVILAGDLNIFRSSKVDGRIISYIINYVVNQDISRIAQGKSVVHVKADELSKIQINYPNSDEQKKLISFLEVLSERIEKQHQLIEALKSYKRGALSKLFPQKGETTPRYRFAGFTEPWEQRKFEDIFAERRERTKIENEDMLLSCAINGMFLNSELFDHFRGTSTIGYLKVKKNDLILSAQNLHLGNANVNLRFEHGIISPAYKVYDIIDCNPSFIQAWVKRDDTKSFFLAATTEGASQCRKNIEWSTLNKQTIPIPSKEEQTLIGLFSHKLDHLITIHQYILDEFIKLKTGLMKKMFI